MVTASSILGALRFGQGCVINRPDSTGCCCRITHHSMSSLEPLLRTPEHFSTLSYKFLKLCPESTEAKAKVFVCFV